MKTELATTDTEFAAALMAKGANLRSWKKLNDGNRIRVQWSLEGIEPEWIEEYRTGRDLFSSFSHARKMLVNIVKTMA